MPWRDQQEWLVAAGGERRGSHQCREPSRTHPRTLRSLTPTALDSQPSIYIAFAHPRSRQIGDNNTAQNCRLAELYENRYNESLAKGLTARLADKIGTCLASLLLPRPDFVAMRIEKALSGWSADKMELVRLLGGLDGRKMLGVLEAYERK